MFNSFSLFLGILSNFQLSNILRFIILIAFGIKIVTIAFHTFKQFKINSNLKNEADEVKKIYFNFLLNILRNVNVIFVIQINNNYAFHVDIFVGTAIVIITSDHFPIWANN